MATLLAFHAHPDDEALLTGGTLARAAAEGHRVVIVVATDGLMGEVPEGGAPRLAELRDAAEALGAHRVAHLGYADSGHGRELYPDPTDRTRFVRADTEDAARRLAVILRQERVDVLIGYDENGGYGHRDHVKVHEVAARAAKLASVPRVLHATRPREGLTALLRLGRLLRLVRGYDAGLPRYTRRRAITHRIDVRRYARQKQAALAAHASQTSGTGRAAPLLRLVLRLPAPVFGLLAGREWFAEADAVRGRGLRRDLLEPAGSGNNSQR
ncbi:PIG-L family deacetylase [Streptomyces sp. NPDC051940]|uniref:PIG-L deacetylase family protein n=1 Tax=Streptomyces sp. NPDC051940 TaxID=3155675 RepID=UPI003424C754